MSANWGMDRAHLAEDRVRVLEAQIKEWAAYCRACQPGPNIADAMEAFLGLPPHDYIQSGATSSARQASAEAAPTSVCGAAPQVTDKSVCAAEAILPSLSQLQLLARALRPLALIPLQEIGKEHQPAFPLMGWNGHYLHVSDVLSARAALKAIDVATDA